MSEQLPDRRRSWFRILHLLLFHDSRKVGFGLWVFIVATVLISIRRIESAHWIECVTLSALLIGGGTLTDKWLNKGGDVPSATQPPAA